MVGGDIISNLQEGLCRDGFRQRVGNRKFFNIGPAENFDSVHLFLFFRGRDHIIVN